MSTYLTALIPTTSLQAWYPLADVTAAGNVATVTDASGKSRTLAATGSTNPDYVLNVLGGRPAIRFNNEDPLVHTPSGSATVKHVVVLAQYTGGSTFQDFNGLVCSTGNMEVPFVGVSGTDKWFDFVYSSSYVKSGVGLPENGMTAAITKPEVMMISNSAGWGYGTSQGIQIGKQENFAARTWKGDLFELMMFDKVLSQQEQNALTLYFDLKYQLPKNTSTTLNFPGPTVTGIDYARYYKVPKDYMSVTVSHVYEDEGRSFNETGTPPQKWEVEFTGLSKAEVQIFDEFYDYARMVNTFNFADKDGTVNTGVRIDTYERSHSEHRSWDNSVKFVLCKY